MYHENTSHFTPPGGTFTTAQVVAALEIPECSCPLVCTHRCDGECDPDAYCACCLGECECRPDDYQPPCPHVLAAEQSPALRWWLRTTLLDIDRELRPADEDTRALLLWGAVQQLLLQHDPKEYGDKPAPPVPLIAVSWDARVKELTKRNTVWGLWSDNDRLVADRLRLAQDLRRGRNGAVIPGGLRLEREVQRA